MKYLLLGMGITNQSIARYFASEGIDFVIYDDKTHRHEINLDDVGIIIKSPGIKNNHFLLQKGKRVIGDLELFYLKNPSKTLITVTGSNGKTTTVKLLKHLIDNIDLGGNIGYPLFDFINSKNDIIIEASSFMLESVRNFRSKYNVILNLFNTHLEYHKSFHNYVNSKLNLIRNARVDDYIIYNYDDLLLRRLINNFQGIKVPFSRLEKVGVHVENKNIIYQNMKIASIDDIKLIGNHNLENVLAAIAVIVNYRGDVSKLSSFTSVKYRLEYKGNLNGLDVYNDSKSTNFKALYNALLSFKNKNILLIAGGKKQNHNFNIFKNINSIRRSYFYGENREIMASFFKNKCEDVITYETLDEVFRNLNTEGCNVLLFSPGSVSFDQFSSYEKRGEYFNEVLNKYRKDYYS